MKITRTIVMASGFFAACSPSSIAADGKEPPQHSIVLSAGNGPFVFGRAISLKVSYRNESKAPWVVPTPTESLSVSLLYRPSGSDRHPQGYTLGRVTTTTVTMPDGKIITAHVMPNPEPLSIALGQTHDFIVEFERDWTGHVVPGIWTVWIEDDDAKLRSNLLEIPLRFTADSVAACLEITLDKGQSLYKRKEHASWLQKIMPGLELRWWSDDTPPKTQEQLQAEIQRQLEVFQKFWKDKANAQVVEAAIARINRESGTEKGE